MRVRNTKHDDDLNSSRRNNEVESSFLNLRRNKQLSKIPEVEN